MLFIKKLDEIVVPGKYFGYGRMKNPFFNVIVTLIEFVAR